MDINRKRPPKDCDDLGLWLSGVISDAIYDATKAGGLSQEDALAIAYSLITMHDRELKPARELRAERDHYRALALEREDPAKLAETFAKMIDVWSEDRDRLKHQLRDAQLRLEARRTNAMTTERAIARCSEAAERLARLLETIEEDSTLDGDMLLLDLQPIYEVLTAPREPDIDKDAPVTCPKCGATSGDDWSQCKGSCPMPGSPHYDGP